VEKWENESGSWRDQEMKKKRNQYRAQTKFPVALEAVRGVKTINQVASEQGLHPNQVSQWQRQLLQEGAIVFSTRSGAPTLPMSAWPVASCTWWRSWIGSAGM
jgi:transposase-like protein